MLTPKQLSSGNWNVVVYAGKDASGKRKYKSFTDTTERKVLMAAMTWQEHYKAIARDSSGMTVEEGITAYIEARRHLLSPSTIVGYKNVKANHLTGMINSSLSAITQKAINQEVKAECEKYSAKTVKNVFGLLSAILKEYRPDFVYSLNLPEVYPKISMPPLDDDLTALCKAAYGTDVEIPLLLAAWLGLRRSEIAGLRWSKITDDYIIIDTAIVRGENGDVEKKTKSKAGTRVLPLPEYIKARMDATPRDGEFVTKLSGNAINKAFVRVCKVAGVGRFRFHSLRHTNATIMMDENIPDKYIAERGGWGSDIYKTVYQHTTASKSNSISKAIDKRFNSLLQK